MRRNTGTKGCVCLSARAAEGLYPLVETLLHDGGVAVEAHRARARDQALSNGHSNTQCAKLLDGNGGGAGMEGLGSV